MAKAAPKQETPVALPGAANKPGSAKPDGDQAQQPQRKRRLRLVLVLFAVLATGGAGAWYALQEQPGTQAAAPEEKEKPPVFLNLEPFTVNLQPEVGDQYLQVGLVVKLKDPAAVDAIKLQMPEIRNRLLLLLSSKRASELATVTGKQQLGAEIMTEIAQPLGSEAVRQQIAAVFFTSFVIQ